MKIIQFGYNKGVPKGMPVVDCRRIKNPFGRVKNDAEMEAWVRGDLYFERIVVEAVQLIASNQQVAIGCSYGRHRSLIVAEEVAKRTGAVIERRE